MISCGISSFIPAIGKEAEKLSSLMPKLPYLGSQATRFDKLWLRIPMEPSLQLVPSPFRPGIRSGCASCSRGSGVSTRRSSHTQHLVCHVSRRDTCVKSAGVPVVMTLHNYRLTCANAMLFREGAICEECVGGSSKNAVRHGCYRDSRIQSAIAVGTVELHKRLGSWTDGIDRFITLTEFQRNVMLRAGLPAEKLVVKPNFVSDPGGGTRHLHSQMWFSMLVVSPRRRALLC